MTLTGYDDLVATFSVDPLPIDEGLEFDQGRFF
jgi:hypothetical protein